MTQITRCLPLNDASVQAAVELLLAGELVAFPTETVYGLGADATQPDAVRKIFQAKGRPADHPLIVHIADGDDPLRWAAQWSELAQRLADVFWPGPLTLIVPRREGVSDLLTGGQNTVGIRCPGHAGAQALLSALRAAGGGSIAAPSANRFGRISPTLASHVMEELGGRIPLVLDGGDANVGIESTIIDVSRGYPVLLRPGDLSAQAIENVLGQRVARPDAQAPRVSGSLESHYAPQRTLRQVPASAMDDVLHGCSLTGAFPVVVLGWSPAVIQAAAANGLQAVSRELLGDADMNPQTDMTSAAAEGRYFIGSSLTEGAGLYMPLSDDVHELAHDLYAALRWADHQPVRAILIEQPPASPEWEGLADRLRRASAGHA